MMEEKTKNSFGAAYPYLFYACCAFGMHSECLPLENSTEDMAAKAKGSMEIFASFLGEEVYGDKQSDFPLDGLKKLLRNSLTAEIEMMLQASADAGIPPKALPHRRREANRRAGDAIMMDQTI
jgi:hypothetical protein